MHITAMKPANLEELLAQPFIKNPDLTIGGLLTSYIAKIGENIQFGPHRVQLLTEANAGAGGADVDDILTAAQLAPVLIEIGRKGHMFEWYVSANGTVPTTAELDSLEAAGTVTGRWFDLYKNVLTAS